MFGRVLAAPTVEHVGPATRSPSAMAVAPHSVFESPLDCALLLLILPIICIPYETISRRIQLEMSALDKVNQCGYVGDHCIYLARGTT